MKKIPQRSCIVCGEKLDKRELFRIVKNKEGELFFDITGKANGRGAYICNKDTCIEAIIKSKVLNKTFKSEISNDIKEKIREDVLNAKE